MNSRYKKIKSLKESTFSLTKDSVGTLLNEVAIYADYLAEDARELTYSLDNGELNSIPKRSHAELNYIEIKNRMEKILNSNLVESLKEGWKDFAFIVKCNDGPKELVRVIAEDRFKAEEQAKKMYAQNHTTYADDRYNIWSIDEDLSSDIDKVKHAVDQFKGQVTVSKDSGNDVREYLLSKNISFMIDDSKSAKGKLTFMLKYPIPKLLNKNENLSGNMTVADIAKKHNVDADVIRAQVDIGKEVEKEHTDNEDEAVRIALDHLFEMPDYYDKLKKMEKGITEGAEGYYKEEDGLENATQEYTSANTSINSAKLPAIFSMVNFKPETINLDYGGGKFDNATMALEGKGVTNLIYDPYNRSSGHNKDVIDTVRKNGGADTVTCSNVLNVIKEPEARKAVIKNIYSLLKNSGTAYFTVYEGTGKGNEGPTKSGYQLNKKTGDYVEEISSVFPSVSRRGKLIIASKGTSLTEKFDDEDDIKYTATGRKKLVSDETMSLAVEAARTVDPNAKRDYDDDFIYGDDGHGGSTWVILLNGDGKAYSTWGRNAVLTSKVEKAVNDAADAYWADFDKRWEENNKHYIESKDGSVNESLKESYLDNLKNPDYWQHQVDYQLEKFGRVGGGLIQDLDEAGFYLDTENKVVKKLHEDTIKTPKIEWTFIKSKEVEDSDGFLTDYTWYEGSDGTQVMVFGDNDIYKPEDGYFDVTFTDRKQAEDWFNSY